MNDWFDLDQGVVAVSDVASSLFWIVLAIIALESVLYLLLMARQTDRRMTAFAARRLKFLK